MAYCIPFRQISEEHRSVVGEKGYFLAKLKSLGFNVPKGVVATTAFFNDFLARNGLKEKIETVLNGINFDDINSAQAASKAIRDLIMAAPFPGPSAAELKDSYKKLGLSDEIENLEGLAKSIIDASRADTYVSIRASMPNDDFSTSLCSSYLYVHGSKGVEEAVKRCWQSAFTLNLLVHRKNSSLPLFPELAVIIQQFVIPEKSGYASAVNVLTGNKDEHLIEAAYGSAESISFGELQPDRYIINFNLGTLVDKNIPQKQTSYVVDRVSGGLKIETVSFENQSSRVLSNEELKAISDVLVATANHVGRDYEIGWCISRGKLHLTGLKKSAVSQSGQSNNLPQMTLISGMPISAGSAESQVKIVSQISDLYMANGKSAVIQLSLMDAMPFLPKFKSVIVQKGSAFSAFARFARKYNIPALVSADVSAIHDGDYVLVDATSGKVYKHSMEEAFIPKPPNISEEFSGFMPPSEYPDTSADSLLATKIKLYTNSPDFNLPENVSGVGMLDLQNYSSQAQDAYDMFGNMVSQQSASMDSVLNHAAEKALPRKVWVKVDTSNEEKLRLCISAIKQTIDKGFSNLGILIPNIHHPSQVMSFKSLSSQHGLDLSKIDFGIIVDSPASAILADDFAKTGINVISLSDELAQHVVGSAEKIDNYEKHAAVMRVFAECIKSYRKLGVHTSFAGSGVKNHALVQKLVQFGIDSISAPTEFLEQTRLVAAREEKRLLLDLLKDRARLFRE